MQHLEAKRGALEKSLEQLVGRVNRVNGAIAVVDELIAEQQARDEAEAQQGRVVWDSTDATMPLVEMHYGGIDRLTPSHWKNEPRYQVDTSDCAPAPIWMEERRTPKEMLPVLPADEPVL